MADSGLVVSSARELADFLVGCEETERLRACIGWATEVADLPFDTASRLVGDEPAATGDRRWDAMLAGLVEHLGAHGHLVVPSWVEEPSRFLEVFWFPVDLPSVRVSAFRDAPASLARRGVFLDRRDLERV